MDGGNGLFAISWIGVLPSWQSTRKIRKTKDRLAQPTMGVLAPDLSRPNQKWVFPSLLFPGGYIIPFLLPSGI